MTSLPGNWAGTRADPISSVFSNSFLSRVLPSIIAPLVGQSLGPSTSYIFLSAESGAEANSTKGWQYCITGPGLRVFLGAAIESVLLDVGQRTSIDLLVGCSRSTTKNGLKKSLNNHSETNHCLWYLVITTKVGPSRSGLIRCQNFQTKLIRRMSGNHRRLRGEKTLERWHP